MYKVLNIKLDSRVGNRIQLLFQSLGGKGRGNLRLFFVQVFRVFVLNIQGWGDGLVDNGGGLLLSFIVRV